ncbi:hypothetical protein GALMADRAFT_223239 [Galerina marginata CBS 339.88]|uniref:Uncharacterized protein n=1 Tax=Galerina marginata (strain CBS 339.88) TaxID=685588 RepID=A0A067TN26_GALM3|nr:hypothetical protein GALMADRAFT_223239 [Galerina marginata CBS 339.88]
MPQWKLPAEVQKDAVAFTKLMHALLGLYAYEFFISLDFEWDFLTGKKRFRWPMIFYFANRYLLLFAMIGIAISFDTTREFNCQALYTFNQLAGDAAVGLASVNLSIRTMAIWSQNRYIIGLLILIILGHWSLILQGVQLTAVWVPGVGCQITQTNNTILATIFIYSMCFDLTVLLLNVYKLLGIKGTKNSELMGRSRLTHMIFADGLIFFIIAFLANLIATVFMVVNLNQIMSVIFNVPAAVFSTIVACRAVRRLTNFTNSGPEVYGATTSSNNRVTVTGPNARAMPTLTYKSGTRSGVHVQMETFTHAEDSQNDFFPKAKEGSDTDVEVDVEAKEAF